MLTLRLCILQVIFVFNVAGNVPLSFKKLRTPDDLVLSIYDYVKEVDRNVTEECSVALNRYADSLSSEELWALKMFDSASKLPAGIIPGEEVDLGNFDQCLSSSSSDAGKDNIDGKYCFGDLEIWDELEGTQIISTNDSSNSVPIQVASCFPNACSATDLSKLYSAIGFSYNISEDDCQSKDSQLEFDLLDTVVLIFLGIVLKQMVMSTAYDIYSHCRKIKQPRQLLLTFSVLTNSKKLLETSKSPDQITCFHGIRVFSVMMIILIHRQGALEALDFHTITKSKQFLFTDMFVLSLRTAVDTFFLISGFLVSYGFMVSSAKRVKFSIIGHWFHRYIRLTSPLAAIILVSTSLVKHLGSGPRWLKMLQRDLENPCKEYWWSSLLYIQNYANPDAICITPTWYLSVDTQLYFLSPVLLLLFYKFARLKPLVLGSLIIGLPFFPLYVAWTEQHRVFNDYGDPVRWKNFFTKIYFPTHVRASSWLIGFATGYIIYATKQANLKTPTKRLPRILVAATWVAMLFIWFFSIFGLPLVVMSVGYNQVFDSFFIAFGSSLWAIAVSGLIYACVHGYAGPINWILSNQLMQVLSKLSYSMYLLHNVIIFFNAYKRRTVPVFEDFDFAYTFWSDYMVSLFLAVFWALAFEFPVLSIEQTFWPRRGKK